MCEGPKTIYAKLCEMMLDKRVDQRIKTLRCIFNQVSNACSGGREAHFSWFLGVLRAAPLVRDVIILNDRRSKTSEPTFQGSPPMPSSNCRADPRVPMLTPFNQRGGLGKAHQLFGEQLPKLLDELNLKLVA